MNASYRLNTCKSRGNGRQACLAQSSTGEWVSNAYPTWLQAGNRLSKERLIPYVVLGRHQRRTKDSSLEDGDASD